MASLFNKLRGDDARVAPVGQSADSFFGKPEGVQSFLVSKLPLNVRSGSLAVRLPELASVQGPPAICTFSRDGKLCITGGREQELYFWDTLTGELVTRLPSLYLVCLFTRDSKTFLVYTEDKRFVLYNTSTWQIKQTMGPFQENYSVVNIASDGKYIVAANETGAVLVWEAAGGQQIHRFENVHGGNVSALGVFFLNGEYIIVSCGMTDHLVNVWSMKTGGRTMVVISELESAKKCAHSISPDGTRIAVWVRETVPFPNLVFIDVGSKYKTSVFVHEGAVRHARFSKDSNRAVTCGGDYKVMLWDTEKYECILTMSGHTAPTLYCSISDDGRFVASCGEDCTTRLWSGDDGRPLMRLESGDRPLLQSSFTPDGRKMLTCNNSGEVYIWSLYTDGIMRAIREQAESLSCCTLSLDKSLLVMGYNNGRVALLDVWTNELRWEYIHHKGRVEAVAISNAEDTVASVGQDGVLSIIDIATGKQDDAFFGVGSPLYSCQFNSPDERVLSVCTDGKAYVWDLMVATKGPKLTLKHNVARINAVAWSPNSKLIVGCCSDGVLMLWNAVSGNITTVLEGSKVSATCITFDSNGGLVAVGNILGMTTVYNIETAEALCVLEANGGPVREVYFSNDVRRLTTICNRQSITWEIATAKRTRTYDFVVDKQALFSSSPQVPRSTVAHDSTVLFDYESEAVVFDIAASEEEDPMSFYLQDTRGIRVGTRATSLVVWSGAGKTDLDRLHTAHDPVVACSFSFCNRLVAAGTKEGYIIVYDVDHSQQLRAFLAHKNGSTNCLKFSADSNEILSCGGDGKVVLWDWSRCNGNNTAALRVLSGHFASATSCDLSMHSDRLVSGDKNGMIIVWEKNSGNNILTLPLAHSKAVISCSISSDGTTMATVGADEKVSIWSTETGDEITVLTEAFDSPAQYCAFAMDGARLAITDSAGNVFVWDVDVQCQWYEIFHAHNGPVMCCSWSADSRRLVTCGKDGIMSVWDAEAGSPLYKIRINSGALTCCACSPLGLHVACGSLTGTVTVCNLHHYFRALPDPSFLFHWLSRKETDKPQMLWQKLSERHQYLANVQDARGWSILLHAVSVGNADIAKMVLETVPQDSVQIGLVSARPVTLVTQVKFHQNEPDMGMSSDGAMMGGGFNPKEDNSVHPFGGEDEEARNNGSGHQAMTKSETGSKSQDFDTAVRSKSFMAKSFVEATEKVSKWAVELFTDQTFEVESTDNNALFMALSSRSSECVQCLLDATATNKVSYGSYHCITESLPSLAHRYPIMCSQFLVALELRHLGDLEVPVNVVKSLERSVISTAQIFTNIKQLWSSQLSLDDADAGPQPYARVKASMVKLPYACAIGKDSFLFTLVTSDVPARAFGSESVKNVIKHKWRLYARGKAVWRAVTYLVYIILFLFYAVLFSKEDPNLSMSNLWKQGGWEGKVSLILDGYLVAMAAYYAWIEASQIFSTGLKHYLISLWNCFDAITSTLQVIICIFHVVRISNGPHGALGPLIAIEVVVLWTKSLYYALVFEPTGPFVHMVFEITRRISNFLALLFMLVCSFGAAMLVLFRYSSPRLWFQDFPYAMLYMYLGSLGGNAVLVTDAETSSWKVVAYIFVCVYLFATQIVLFNLIIAMMKEAYDAVKATEEDIFLKGRAQWIIEVEGLMPKRQVEQFMRLPPYVHLLTPVKRNQHNPNSMEGRMERLEAMILRQTEVLGFLLLGTLKRKGGGAADLFRSGATLTPSDVMMTMEGLGLHNQFFTQNLFFNQMTQDGEEDKSLNESTASKGYKRQNTLVLENGQQGGGPKQESKADLLLPALTRQVERLQRTMNNQEMRLESMAALLNDIELLMRDRKPVANMQRKGAEPLTEAQLEAEVKRLLGKSHGGNAPINTEDAMQALVADMAALTNLQQAAQPAAAPPMHQDFSLSGIMPPPNNQVATIAPRRALLHQDSLSISGVAPDGHNDNTNAPFPGTIPGHTADPHNDPLLALLQGTSGAGVSSPGAFDMSAISFPGTDPNPPKGNLDSLITSPPENQVDPGSRRLSPSGPRKHSPPNAIPEKRGGGAFGEDRAFAPAKRPVRNAVAFAEGSPGQTRERSPLQQASHPARPTSQDALLEDIEKSFGNM